MATSISFTSAVSKYFGRKPGQTMAEFRDEIVGLSPKDKDEMRVMLASALGCDVEPYSAPTV